MIPTAMRITIITAGTTPAIMASISVFGSKNYKSIYTFQVDIKHISYERFHFKTEF